MLHLIQKSPYQHSALKDCLAIIAKDDTILLMLDGVYASTHVELLKSDNQVYVLADDLKARGLKSNENHTCINYEEFVALTAKADKVLSWF